jgi:serine/threonine-protein kinase ULK2
MAPEILRYEKYDAKADLWSVGAVLFEMAVGKPPFRAMNHIDLLKKIDQSKGIKFPDEEPSSTTGRSGAGGSEDLPVPGDVKKLIRALLKRNPVERASFNEFFGSTALAKSKFPRPKEGQEIPISVAITTSSETDGEGKGWTGRPATPEHHRMIPPEVLDPNVMIPPSKFNFRRASGEGGDGSPLTANGVLPRDGCVLRLFASRFSDLFVPSSNSSRERFTGGPSEVARPSLPKQHTKPLSTEGSIIPGETEEDGLLRREYVLVGDTRAVEFNRTIDGTTIFPVTSTNTS